MSKIKGFLKGKKVMEIEKQQAEYIEEMITLSMEMVSTTEEDAAKQKYEEIRATWLELEMNKVKILAVRGAIGGGLAIAAGYGIIKVIDALTPDDETPELDYYEEYQLKDTLVPEELTEEEMNMDQLEWETTQE